MCTFSKEEIALMEKIFQSYSDANHSVFIGEKRIKWTEYGEYQEIVLEPDKYLIKTYRIPDRAMPRVRTEKYLSKEHALYWFLAMLPNRATFKKGPHNQLIKDEKKAKMISEYEEKLEEIYTKEGIKSFDYSEI